MRISDWSSDVCSSDLNVLRGALVLPAPTTAGAAAELNEIATKLQSASGKGKGTLNGQPINGSDIEAAMGTNRSPAQLKEMWVRWHDNVGKPLKATTARWADNGKTQGWAKGCE